SRGARALNRIVPAALGLLPAEHRAEVWHQTGAEHEAACEAYAQAGVEARVVAFIDDMAAAYEWADLAVARAGALTISELAAAGLGAVLVPYPYATDDHQTANAEQLAGLGAAVVIQERELDAERLAAQLEALTADRPRLAQMAAAARRLSREGAAERLAEACVELTEARA
ncbi:MAG TPA: glycosyltransferase, partial [Gammaproteobacteria bacterium]|nr:glycosyltransferase [Gammaproteobacteria bacterium]